MKKQYIAIGLSVLVLILSVNVYFWIHLNKDETLLKIDGEVVLSEAELSNILLDKYKNTAINGILSSKLIQSSAQKIEIPDITDNDLEWLKSDFPNYLSDKSDFEQLQEFYNVYKIYDTVSNLDDDINKFFTNLYASEPTLYTVASFIGQDHESLMAISSDLDQGESIEAIDKKYNIHMDIRNEPSLNSYKVTEDEVSNKTIHVDLGNHDMMIVFLLDKNTYTTETKPLFKDYYFSNRYLQVKAQVVNLLKDNFQIEYE